VISDKCLRLVESIGECFPEADWQPCIVHLYRNVFRLVPKGKVREVATMLKAIHAQEDLTEARAKATAIAKKLQTMKLTKASEILQESAEETLTYYRYPSEHWRMIRTNNQRMCERFWTLLREQCQLPEYRNQPRRPVSVFGVAGELRNEGPFLEPDPIRIGCRQENRSTEKSNRRLQKHS